MEEKLPKAYEPQTVEDGLYSRWEKSGLFNPDNLPGERKGSFTIMMPPPNATGTLHIGHAMFLTLEDLMTRFNRMRGKAALWLPGTDHAAIATNTKVEKIIAKEGKTKYDLGREGFIERVEEFITGSQGTIRRQIRKMGSSCDWSREAYTFDDQRSRVVREVFTRMYDEGLIYRGYRIVNWCPRCESTLADDEVEYKDQQGKLYYMKYGPFVVATTRPETKLGDTAVAVHPEDERYKDMIGQMFTVDFGIGPQEIRVIPEEGVDREFGTGVVGVTPAHSAVDFAMAEKNLLPIKKVIGEDGKMTALAGKYAGMTVADARAAFVADLEKGGLIERVEDINNNLSVCYRCGTAVEPLTSRQWFVDVNAPIARHGGKSLKMLSLEAVRENGIKILPERFEKVYFHWMENLRDWCISRQIWFGHRVPVWYCNVCHVNEDAPERVGDPEAKEDAGRKGLIVAVEPPTSCPDCGQDTGGFTQDPDTLDTWFSSGTWTFSTLGWPEKTADLAKFHPTSVLETGYDILFFWIARMILMTTYALGEVPFKTVYLHGLVRDEEGRKMSKSLENIIDPLDVAEKFGTDAVRLSLVIGNSPGNDLRLSEEKIAHFRNFANKLWNISRFILMNVPEPKKLLHRKKISDTSISESERSAGGYPGPILRPEPKTLADRWILSRLDAVVVSVTKDIEGFDFSRPGETLRDFTWGELADWYLEVAKIEQDKAEILSYILSVVLKLWHPFMPFVTEEIYGKVFAEGDDDFLMVAEWPAVEAGRFGGLSSTPHSMRGSGTVPGSQDVEAEEEFDAVREVVTAIRNIRATYTVEPGKEIEATMLAAVRTELMKENKEIIERLTKCTLTILEKGDKPDKSAGAVVAGVEVFVPLADMIDADKERERLEKEIADTERYATTLDKKLGNAEFVERAPAPVVEKEKVKLAEAKEKLERLKAQLTELG